MTLGRRALRAQNSMEYILIIGVSALVIALVLIGLTGVGVFHPQGGVSDSCLANQGYECQDPLLSSKGVLAFTLGQSTGVPMYNIELACTSELNSTGYPSTGITAFNAITASGAANTTSAGDGIAGGGTSLDSGATIAVTNIQCTGPGGSAFGASGIGSDYTGYILLNFTAAPNRPPYYTTEIAEISVKSD